MSSHDNTSIVPGLLRFGNYLRRNTEKQRGYISKQRSPLELLIFNFIPAGLASTVLAPLNRLRVILQVQSLLPDLPSNENGLSGSANKTNTNNTNNTSDPSIKTNTTSKNTPSNINIRIPHLISTITKSEGYLSLFKGNSAYLSKLFAQFISKTIIIDRTKFFFEYNKKAIDRMKYKILGANLLLDLVCAFVASASTVILSYPFDLVYARMTAQIESANGNSGNYKTIKSCFHGIERGNLNGNVNVNNNSTFAKYYNGFLAGALGSLVYSVMAFTGYQVLYRFDKDNNLNTNSDGENKTNIYIKAGPAMIGLFAGIIAYPFDTVKRIQQVNGAKGYKGLYANYNDIIASHNVKYLYRGVSLYLLRNIPFASLQYFCFSKMSDVLRSRNKV